MFQYYQFVRITECRVTAVTDKTRIYIQNSRFKCGISMLATVLVMVNYDKFPNLYIVYHYASFMFQCVRVAVNIWLFFHIKKINPIIINMNKIMKYVSIIQYFCMIYPLFVNF